MTTLAQAIQACTDARNEALEEIRRNVGFYERRWLRSREPRLIPLDVNGNRLDDVNFVTWRRRMSDIKTLRKINGCVEIIVDSGIDYASTRDDLENFNYDTEFWQATVWKSA